MNVTKVVIIIPTYNESLAIEETLQQVFQATECVQNKDVHVLVFDSASTDNTQNIILDLQTTYPKLHLKTESKKSGLGSAYLQAMRYALNDLSADIIIEFDADLSHQPQYIAPILEKMDTYDVVLGSRYIRGGHIPDDWGWHRKLLSVLGNYIARFVLTPKYKDFTTGFRATRREALLQALPEKFLSNQFAYKLELLWRLHKNKAKIAEYPIVFVDRKSGQSKLPTNSIMDALRVIFTLRFRTLAPYFRMCLVGLSGAMIQYLLYNLLRHKLPPVNAAQFAVFGAIINNFTLNNQFTFKNNPLTISYKTLKSLAFFVGYSVFMIGCQSYWLHLGIKYFGAGLLKENIILITGIILGSILNYVIYSNFIWRKSKPLVLSNEA
jgi:dolichol-phosphate mannosyltransferase